MLSINSAYLGALHEDWPDISAVLFMPPRLASATFSVSFHLPRIYNYRILIFFTSPSGHHIRGVYGGSQHITAWGILTLIPGVNGTFSLEDTPLHIHNIISTGLSTLLGWLVGLVGQGLGCQGHIEDTSASCMAFYTFGPAEIETGLIVYLGLTHGTEVVSSELVFDNRVGKL